MGIDPIDNAIQDILTGEISRNRAFQKIFPHKAERFDPINERLETLSEDLRALLENLSPNSPWTCDKTRQLLHAIRSVHVDCCRDAMAIVTEGGGPAELRDQCNAVPDGMNEVWLAAISQWEAGSNKQ